MTSINWPPKDKLKLIGTRIDRIDGPPKSSGAAKYSLDINRPEMLYGKILGAPIASGTLVSLDTSAAEALHGVEAVHVMTDPGKPINWAGQEIVALAAISEEIATEALKLVRAEYETKAPQTDDSDPAKAEGRPRTQNAGDATKAFADAATTSEGRVRRFLHHALLLGTARPGFRICRKRYEGLAFNPERFRSRGTINGSVWLTGQQNSNR